MTTLGVDLEKSNLRGETVLVPVSGGGGPVAMSDVTGLLAALGAKADATAVASALSSLSVEIGTKATQTSVDALSNGLATTNSNLGSVSSTANAAASAASSAGSAAAAAQTTANNAIPKTDRVTAMSTRGVLSGAVIPLNGTVPVGMQPYDLVIERSA